MQLLRFWFNKDGRKWHEKKILTPTHFNYDNPEENKYADISPDLHKKRLEWAWRGCKVVHLFLVAHAISL